MYRFTSISAFTFITLLTATMPISASSHDVTVRTSYVPFFRLSLIEQAPREPKVTGRMPYNSPTSQPHVMNGIVPTAHRFRLKVDGFQEKTVVTFGKLESALTLQIPLSEIDTEFYNWITTTLPKSEGGQGDVTSSTVRTASLIAHNAEDKAVLRWNLSNAWVKSYRVPKLDTPNKDSAVTTLEMVFTNIQQGGPEKAEPECTEGGHQ